MGWSLSARKMLSSSQKLKPSEGSESSDSDDSHGILNERILLIIFNSIKCDLHVLCLTASVSRKLRAVARRLLWKQLCLYRAPRILQALTCSARASGGGGSRFAGEWHSLAKLLFFCCGAGQDFAAGGGVAGHFTATSRFSKTSGKSFLMKKCWGDLLYVSDPCEHEVRRAKEEDDDLVGIYRGVFRGFNKSFTRAALIRRQVALDERVRCPYCGSRVWNMTAARLVPRTAARRLGSRDEGFEYFVCLNGHLHGTCWLVPLSSDEDELNVEEDDGSEDGDQTAGDGAADDESQTGTDLYINGV